MKKPLAIAALWLAGISLSNACESGQPNHFRYIVCSHGVYDREHRDYLVTVESGKLKFPIAKFPDFQPVVIRGTEQPFLAGLVGAAPEERFLAFRNGNEMVMAVHRTVHDGRKHFRFVMVGKRTIDKNQVAIGGVVDPVMTCDVTEGERVCDLKYIHTNQPYYNYYATDGRRVLAIVLSYRD